MAVSGGHLADVQYLDRPTREGNISFYFASQHQRNLYTAATTGSGYDARLCALSAPRKPGWRLRAAARSAILVQAILIQTQTALKAQGNGNSVRVGHWGTRVK